MKTIDVIIENETGLHARPASIFVKEASKYKSDIKIIKDDKQYDAKSILSILSMGAIKGTRFTIMANGHDEKEVLDALKLLVDIKFGE